MTPFNKNLKILSIALKRERIDVLQVNFGKLCNQSCAHCHVDAGPNRKEAMTRETVNHVLNFISASQINTVDITGGAPELNPNFEYFVSSLKNDNRQIIVRSNLTIILEYPGETLPQFYKKNRVELICSLPCYKQENVDRERGQGVYKKSIEALKILNKVGYGHEHSKLTLNLAYNPGGPFLPPPQKKLEADYKNELFNQYEIVFNNLYVLTNIPINRYEKYLKKIGQYKKYLRLLKENFNPNTIKHLMCRRQVNVGWDGKIYDCDFNQMLGLHLHNGKTCKIGETTLKEIMEINIQTRDHCYGCAAGSGSSCGGSLTQ
jgi:radical SAM/Cys-rich protein